MSRTILKKVIVFAGTNEGRKICEFLANNDISVTACIATAYGSQTMPKRDNLTTKEGRLSLNEITELVQDFDYVIDATHPYAQVISGNIKIAVKDKQKTYLRVIRPAVGYENVYECADIEKACEYINTTSGNVLVTTGSKELLPYTLIENYSDRLFLRVLPTVEAISECNRLGFKAANILCMQGPFSENMNVASLEQVNAKYLVTKEAGKSGGFLEKLAAARKLDVKVVLVGRPYKEDGLTFEQACELLKNELNIEEKTSAHFPCFINLTQRKVVVVGGGNVGIRRAKALLKFNAIVTVISPEISDELKVLSDKICIINDKYDKKYINNAFLIIAATNNRNVNQKIYKEANKLKILVNIADKKDQSDFYFPALFSSNDISGGLISINGENHKLAKVTAAMIDELLNSGR